MSSERENNNPAQTEQTEQAGCGDLSKKVKIEEGCEEANLVEQPVNGGIRSPKENIQGMTDQFARNSSRLPNMNMLGAFKEMFGRRMQMQNKSVNHVQESELVLHNILALSETNRLLQKFSIDQERICERLERLEIQMKEMKAPPPRPVPMSNLADRQKVRASSKDFFSRPQNYEYQLVLENEVFPKSLFRDRNFSFKVCIVDQEGKMVDNRNKMTAKIQIFTSELPPRQLVTNTTGKTILRGNYETVICSGVASFEKIRISEVTSHLPRGWISLVIMPIELPTTQTSPQADPNDARTNVDPAKIKPLVLERVVIKAKKDKIAKESSSPRE